MKTTIEVVNNEVIVTGPNGRRVHKYKNFINAADVTFDLTGREVRRLYKPKDIADLYNEAGDKLGMSVAMYCKMLIGAQHRAYVVPEIDIHNRFDWEYSGIEYKKNGIVCHKMRWFRNARVINRVNSKIDIIKEYINDSNPHLAGFSLLTGNAYNSKRRIGKGLWKRFSKTSKSRNDSICKLLFAMAPSFTNVERFMHMLRTLETIKSTLLGAINKEELQAMCSQQFDLKMYDLIPKIVKHINRPMYTIAPEEIRLKVQEVVDCARMRQNFNPKWSIKRIMEEHAIGVKEAFHKKYPNVPFSSTVDLPKYFEDEDKGFKATLLNTALIIAEHGEAQHHCIANYIDQVTEGTYAVYKIEDGIKTTTLGISHSKFSTQHYGLCNSIVKNTDKIVFANNIIHEVRGLLKKEVAHTLANQNLFANHNDAPAVVNPNGPALGVPLADRQLDDDGPRAAWNQYQAAIPVINIRHAEPDIPF